MPELRHGFRIDPEKCRGRMNCMRTCPTHAIRVKDGKARLLPELCIDCGSCLGVCPSGAISATTITFAELGRFKFKVAVPSPAFFAQFGLTDTPARVGRVLLEMGFDAVWEYGLDIEIIDRAITDCVKTWPGPFPLISNSCPVIVRLVQVAYPSMIEHLIPIESPREIAGREVKRKYSRDLGLKPEDIAAIYIAPCQAKTISIARPAEEGESSLDGAVGISQIYNDVLYRLRRLAPKEALDRGAAGAGDMFYWGPPEGEFPRLSREHYLPLTGLPDVLKVFDDIERGRIRGIEFLECHACEGACLGGNLTVENLYAARAKSLHLIAATHMLSPEFEKEVERRYPGEDVSLRRALNPGTVEGPAGDLRERVLRRKRADELVRGLPLLDCGLCGAPTCRSHAEDAAAGRADLRDCVFLSRDRIERLAAVYRKAREHPGEKPDSSG